MAPTLEFICPYQEGRVIHMMHSKLKDIARNIYEQIKQLLITEIWPVVKLAIVAALTEIIISWFK